MFRRRLLRAFVLTTLAAGPLTLAAQEPEKPAAPTKAATGTAPGDVIPSSFRAYVATDTRYAGLEVGRNRAKKMHDLVIDNALNPVVAVFSRQPPILEKMANPEVAKLAVKLNELVVDKELKAARFGSFVTFLVLDKEYPEASERDARTKDAEALTTQLKTLGVPFALAAGKSDAVTAWGIDEKDVLTVVFYREMKVVEKWKYTADKPLGDDDVKTIAARVEKELRAKK